MTEGCPLCENKRMIEELEVNFSLEHGIVKTKLGWVTLSRIESLYFDALYKAKYPIDRERLLVKVYGDEGYEKTDNLVQAHIVHIRNKINPLGLNISLYSQAYFLESFTSPTLRKKRDEPLRTSVFNIIKEHQEIELSEITKMLPDDSKKSIRATICYLFKNGYVVRPYAGVYAIPKSMT